MDENNHPDSQDETQAADPNPVDVPVEPAGRRLGDFEILRELGRGGMGVVYEARQISLKRTVALKTLPPALGLGRDSRERFEREAHAAARLHHANIVPVHAIGEDDGTHFYAMEMIEGQSLDVILTDLVAAKPNALIEATLTRHRASSSPGRVSSKPAETTSSGSSATGRQWFDAVARLLADVADALDYAHQHGVIHRDVKPGNLLLSEDGRLMISDFGLARLSEEPGVTITGSLVGTPAYMSPEQVAAGRMKLDHRTDVYSLGTVLYELLTMQRPFRGNREEIVAGIMTKDPRPPRRKNRRIPVDLETICLKAMEKDPDRRFQSAGEMAVDLRQYLQGDLIDARRAGLPRRVWRSIRRHPVAATAAVAVVTIGILVGVAWYMAAARAAETVERHLAEARFAQSEGDHEEARRTAELVLESRPKEDEARLIRAQALIELDEGQRALDEALVELRADPDDWIAHLIVASAAASWGTFYGGEIEPHVEAMERLSPETPEALRLRADVTDSAREALDLLDRALSLSPGDEQALGARAHRYYQLKDFQAGMADADRILAARPKSHLGHFVKAEGYLGLHDDRRAMEEADAAVTTRPDRARSYAWRAYIRWQAQGDLDGAIADIDRAIELAPDNPIFRRNRVDALSRAGRYEEALDETRLALELQPGNVDLWNLEIGLLFQMGRREEIPPLEAKRLEQAQTWTDPKKLGRLHHTRSNTAFASDDLPRALEELNRAVDLDPENWLRLLLRAYVRGELGDADGAREDCELGAAFELDEPEDLVERSWRLEAYCGMTDHVIENIQRAEELAPHWADVHNRWAVINIRILGDMESAIEHLGRCIELADQWVDCYRNRGRLLERLGRLEESLRDVDAIMQMRPDEAQVMIDRSNLLIMMGQLDDALAALDRAVELEPSRSERYVSRAHVLALLDRCDDAAADVAKAHELNPEAVDDSWLHATSFVYACPQLYDLDYALEVSEHRLRRDPRGNWNQHNHAILLYRAGRYEDALELQQQADKGLGGQAATQFWLAMVQWKLGHQKEARERFDAAVDWWRSRTPDDPTLVLLHDEAAALVGVGD